MAFLEWACLRTEHTQMNNPLHNLVEKKTVVQHSSFLSVSDCLLWYLSHNLLSSPLPSAGQADGTISSPASWQLPSASLTKGYSHGLLGSESNHTSLTNHRARSGWCNHSHTDTHSHNLSLSLTRTHRLTDAQSCTDTDNCIRLQLWIAFRFFLSKSENDHLRGVWGRAKEAVVLTSQHVLKFQVRACFFSFFSPWLSFELCSQKSLSRQRKAHYGLNETNLSTWTSRWPPLESSFMPTFFLSKEQNQET